MSDESQTSDTSPTLPLTVVSFDELVGPHLPVLLLRVAGSLCRNSHDAEDLVQDTLLRAFKSLRTFDGVHPRAWLLTIMRNAKINRHRRQRRGLLYDAADLAGEADRRIPAAPSAEDVAAATACAPTLPTPRLPEQPPMTRRAMLDMFRRKGRARCIEIGPQIRSTHCCDCKPSPPSSRQASRHRRDRRTDRLAVVESLLHPCPAPTRG